VLATAAVRPDLENEDFAAVTPAAAVLLDGAGTPAGLDSGCVHGVAWYARTLGTILLARISAASSGGLAECLHDAIGEVRSLHGPHCDLSHPGTPAATVVTVRIRGGMVEHLVLCDSSLVLRETAGGIRVVTDQRIDDASRPFRRTLSQTPNTAPQHPAVFRDYVQGARTKKNVPGGYWVASADPAAAGQALTGSDPLADIEALLLLSDGATRLADLFGLVSWAELTGIVSRDGPEELIRQVRAAEAADPDARRWKRGKPVDDATVICCDQLDADPVA
jgi:hypothetical protein